MCAHLEASIEGATHAMGQRILYRSRGIISEEEERRTDEEDSENEKAGEESLRVETAGIEE